MKKLKKTGGLLLSLCLTAQMLVSAAGPAMTVHAQTYTDTAGRGFNVPVTWEEGEAKVTLPEAPAGWEIELFGSDRKQVVDLDGTVTKPLNDVSVSLLYKLTNKTSGEVIETNVNTAVQISADALEDYAAGDNVKPEVIPSLREWKGGSGDVTLTQEASRIIVDSENFVEEDASHQKANIGKTGNFYTQVISFQEDLKDMTGLDLPIVKDAVPDEGDIYFTSEEAPQTLGDQGYILEIGGADGRADYTVVKAVHKTGALYGGVTMLQILKQTGNTLPKGITRDYPQFEKRGYMLDVARTFLPASYLEDTMKQMSWYKLNTFSLHLSDNEIWNNLTLDTPIYAAYRLESDVEGLTARDGYYTKDEFRELQYDGMDLGVNVIPELDTPGHALSYTRVWPDLARSDNGKYLDVTNPQTIERVKALFDEYVIPQDGKEEVFVGPEVNIGTDEYKNGNKEAFRAYVNGLLNHIKERGKRPAFWGSLLENSGSTQVMTDALMFAWYQGYADAKKSLDDGYEVFSMEDGEVYIVPGGGYYSNQYGQAQYLYNSWLPNNNNGWKSASAGYNKSPAPLGHPRAVGGQFAVWNDWVGNGISVGDISFRIQYNLMSVAQKCWSIGESSKTYNEFKELGETLGDAPNCDFLYTNQNFDDDKVLDLENYEDLTGSDSIIENTVNVEKRDSGRSGDGLQFTGGESYLKTGVTSTGFDWTLGMWINPDEGNGEDVVLMEGKTGTLKLKQGKTGRLGYSVDKLFDEQGTASVDKFNHYFDYKVPAGQWTHIALSGDAYGVKLYVNGVFVDELRGKAWPNYNPASGQNSISGVPPYYETLMLPTAVIGSRTNAFRGAIDELKIYDRVLTQSEITEVAGIPIKERENLALGKTVTASGNETQGKWQYDKVVDGNKSGDSRWSSNYSDEAWLTVDLGKTETVSEIDIFWESAYAVKYKMLVSENGTDWKEVFNEENGEGGSPKAIAFDPVSARYVKFQGVERKPIGGTKYGFSMYELEVYGEKDERTGLAEKINEISAALEGSLFMEYPDKKKELQKALGSALELLTNADATNAEMLEKMKELDTLLSRVLPENLMKGAAVSTTAEYWPGFEPAKMADGSDAISSRFATKRGATSIPAEFTLEKESTFNQLVIKEGLGAIEDNEVVTEQIKGYKVEVEKNGAYETVLSAGKEEAGLVGKKLILDLGKEITASKLRVTFETDASSGINVTEVELYQMPDPDAGVYTTARSIAHNLKMPAKVTPSQAKFPVPEVPDGYTVRILNSSSPEIIAEDGTLNIPEGQKEVILLMEVAETAGDAVQERAAVSYVVKASNRSYTVTFQPNGGTAGESSRSIKDGQEVGTLPNAAREGYTFLGWFTASQGGVKADASYLVEEDVTLYAQWKQNTVPDPGKKPQVSFGQQEYNLYATQSLQTSVNANADAGKVTGYRSDQPSVASISASGLLTGLRAGTAAITVTTESGTAATVKVTVKTPKVTLTARKAPLQKGKSTKAVKVDTKISTDRLVSCTSSKPSVVSVTNKGVIKAKKPGTAKITFKMKSGAAASCTIKVQKKAVKTTGIKVPQKLSLKVKQKTTLEAVRSPITATEKITFRSSNSKIASVNKKGVITAKKKGSCKIQVICNKKTKKVTVTVK